MSRYTMPCIVWIDAAAREQLTQFAQGSNASLERAAGRLLTLALREHSPGEFAQPDERKVTLRRDGKPGRQSFSRNR